MDLRMFSLAVRTLALPPSEQKNIYAPFADITFELVDDFEKATTTGNFKEYEATLDEGRRRAINSLKQAIERLEGQDWEYDGWDIEAVLSRSAWVEVRERARDVLRVFDIPLGEVPRDTKVPGTNSYIRRSC